MEEKARVMSRAENFASEAEHNDAREGFDRQHTKLQIACEKNAVSSELVDQSTRHCLPAPTDVKKSAKGSTCRNNGIWCPHRMSVQQAVQRERECAKEMEAIHSRAPHLREEYLAESHRRPVSKKKTAKAKSIERMIAKERDRS